LRCDRGYVGASSEVGVRAQWHVVDPCQSPWEMAQASASLHPATVRPFYRHQAEQSSSPRFFSWGAQYYSYQVRLGPASPAGLFFAGSLTWSLPLDKPRAGGSIRWPSSATGSTRDPESFGGGTDHAFARWIGQISSLTWSLLARRATRRRVDPVYPISAGSTRDPSV
jgi:hypothetical protein